MQQKYTQKGKLLYDCKNGLNYYYIIYAILQKNVDADFSVWYIGKAR